MISINIIPTVLVSNQAEAKSAIEMISMLCIEAVRPLCYNEDAALEGTAVSDAAQHLDNRIQPDFTPSEGDSPMAKKFNQYITINGEKRWISGNSVQDFADKIIHIASKATPPQSEGKHPFKEYATDWMDAGEPNWATATTRTYRRQLEQHIFPALGKLTVEDITLNHVQRLFNGIRAKNGKGVTKETKKKVRMVLSQILDSAVEDELLRSNPLKSKRFKLSGEESRYTEPYTKEQMQYLSKHIGDIENPTDRAFLALMLFHPLRLEEALGLQGKDVDAANKLLRVRQVATHPTRNQPEIREPKTKSSVRTLALSEVALDYLPKDVSDRQFLFGGDKPLTYSQVRTMCRRIKQDTGFDTAITPIRFRTTTLTDLYDQTKDVKLVQAAAGHATSAMTMNRYVRGREGVARATEALEGVYAS